MFSKHISNVTTEDLAALVQEGAVENIRLEFKSEMPSKHETLKKLSSFANTYGGHLVIGAHADSSDGKLIDFPGIEVHQGLKQRIVQWCFDGVTPPLTIEVSEPIQSPNNADKVCYLVFVRESDLAPHFLNGRKGVYVRTDEFSQRYEPKLATQRELMHLLERRKLILDRRSFIISRARARFDAFVNTRYAELGSREEGIGARFDLVIVPRFPSQQICSQEDIPSCLDEVFIPWRGTTFPRRSLGFVSQHESGIILRPGTNFSLLEFNVWGLLYYASEIEIPDRTTSGIHLYSFIGNLLVFLKHAAEMVTKANINGALQVEMKLDGIRGVPLMHWQYGNMFEGSSSVLDDSVCFSVSSTAEELIQRYDGVAMDILKYAFFSLNWADSVKDRENLRSLVKEGYDYNSWSRPTSLRE